MKREFGLRLVQPYVANRFESVHPFHSCEWWESVLKCSAQGIKSFTQPNVSQSLISIYIIEKTITMFSFSGWSSRYRTGQPLTFQRSKAARPSKQLSAWDSSDVLRFLRHLFALDITVSGIQLLEWDWQHLAALLANFGRCLFKLFPWGFQGLPNPTLSNSMHNCDDLRCARCLDTQEVGREAKALASTASWWNLVCPGKSEEGTHNATKATAGTWVILKHLHTMHPSDTCNGEAGHHLTR